MRRSRRVLTTAAGKDGQRAGDLLGRDFIAPAPNRHWVADFTYATAWSGIVYVAFVVDIYSRAIVGWAAATRKHAKLVLGALQMALWRRDRDGRPTGPGLVHHSDAGSYTSFAFTAHLIEAGIDASIGTVGDALDSALMESAIGLCQTELIKKRGPWKTLADVELATAEYVDWFNTRRLPPPSAAFLQPNMKPPYLCWRCSVSNGRTAGIRNRDSAYGSGLMIRCDPSCT